MGRGKHTTNVGKFAVLEDEEILASCNLLERLSGAIGPIGDNIAMSLEKTDVVTHVLGKLDQLSGCLHVGRQAKVGLFD